MKIKQHPGRAFTLIELLIAITILMIVITAIYSTWITVARAQERGEKAAADVQRSRMAMRSLEGALAGATMFSQNIVYYSFDVDTTGDYAMLSFVARLPETFPGGGLFPGKPLRRVTFTVEPDADGVNTLVMRQQEVLTQFIDGMEPYRIDLARNVSTFLLDFWDTNANDWAVDWVYTNSMPKMVRVTLGTGGTKNVLATEDIVSKVVSIPSETVTPEFQLAQGGGNVQQVNLGAGGLPPVQGGGNNGKGKNNGKGGNAFGGNGQFPGGQGGFYGGPGGGGNGQVRRGDNRGDNRGDRPGGPGRPNFPTQPGIRK